MNNENAINAKMLTDHFEGRSTPLEKKRIEDWLANPENMERYYQALDEWEASKAQMIPDEARAWKKISASKSKQLPKMSTGAAVFPLKYWLVAAVMLCIVTTGAWLAKDVLWYKTIATTFGEVKQVTLPDGSLVTLNANTSIRFARYFFGNKTRIVHLKGEADFAVVHTKSNQKFIVKTNDSLEVTVLGTQFSVYAREANAKVVLREGKVSLAYQNNKETKALVLKPGDFFIKHNEKGVDTLEHITNTEDVVAWKKHDFLFETTPMSEVANLLKDNFGITMRFQEPALAARKISGSFHADKAEELVDAIAQLLDINYKLKNDVVVFFE